MQTTPPAPGSPRLKTPRPRATSRRAVLRLAALFSVALALALPAGAWAESPVLHVYSGAGLRPAVEPLAQAFEAETGTRIALEYGGTGQILARARTTGRGDVFLAGTRFFSDKLAAEGRISGVVALGIHAAAIGVTPARAGAITGVADLAQPGLRLALGDPQAMALGRTADEIMDRCGDAAAIRANTVVRTTTLQQLALHVAQGNVDAAILSVSAARPHGDKIRIVAIPLACYTPEEITAGVLSSATDPARAAEFVAFLASPRGQAAFAAAGFAAPAD
ncbi:molybdate ABC transporter substrate-binding protein [Phaeovulum vinaykumarii]|uniref:Molybdate transport system substrate-binding protein n=1 Tax=Phaeovulum vinaykumarii TaxID=407234 RepID=A0A1N7L8G6_9RHOB|nr:molybdate ABC transporter substrate-binding protein [Phaeovulum vinaykumarii]SIS70134.1 molybdate transport system substrate-binding protein [Phaeovulum vinaykumarii]SOB99100.1 molybdate transport system substrate-binding protein [Phaeovulum vinaykumarii]